MPLPDAQVERALVVAAHPDDIEFGCAGTVARWVDAGIRVTYLVVTYGDAGGFDEDLPREQMPRIRAAEQRAAAAAVGVEDVRFLDGYRDGSVTVTEALVRDLTRVVRQVRPQRVLGQSPERWWDLVAASHPDHLAVGEATVRAVYPFARNPFAFPELATEGLQAWEVPELWLAAHPSPDHWVDVTETAGDKLAALAAHESQTGHRLEETHAQVRAALLAQAREAGLPPGRYAEAFKVVDTR